MTRDKVTVREPSEEGPQHEFSNRMKHGWEGNKDRYAKLRSLAEKANEPMTRTTHDIAEAIVARTQTMTSTGESYRRKLHGMIQAALDAERARCRDGEVSSDVSGDTSDKGIFQNYIDNIQGHQPAAPATKETP